MGRFAGRHGRIYLGITSAGAATPMPFVANWELNYQTDKFDVTAFGDTNKVTVAGLPGATGSFSGWMDDSTAQTYTAAVDGQPRPIYIYPNLTNTPTLYFYGTVNLDASFSAGVDGAGTFSASWEAATTIQRQPAS